MGKATRRKIEAFAVMSEIDAKVERARKAFGTVGYVAEHISTQEFHDYMTGEIFPDDPTTLG